MPTGRAKGRSRPGRSEQKGSGRRPGNANKQDDGVHDIFHEMLAEVEPPSGAGEMRSSPLKRRKLNEDEVPPFANTQPATRRRPHREHPPKKHSLAVPLESESEMAVASEGGDEHPGEHGRSGVAAEQSDGSEESEFEWEEVELQQGGNSVSDDESDKAPIQDLDIVLGERPAGKDEPGRIRRKGITSLERKRRLDIHKMHVLCLVYHSYVRNRWCNDREVQSNLKRLVPPRIVSSLHPDPAVSQFQAAESFMNGLHHIKKFWNDLFSIDAYGMRRPRWAPSEEELQHFKLIEYSEPPTTFDGFRVAGKTLHGSQDIGAQLFCALLRSIGVEARLVCSLQCLPFTAVAPVRTVKPKSEMKTIHLDSDGNRIVNKAQSDVHAAASRHSINASPSRPQRITQIGRPGRGVSSGFDKGKAPQMRVSFIKPKIRSEYPVFWVEAFNPAHQKWITVDPLATFTVDKPSKLEPPINSEENALIYAIAYEEDGTAKDVTRRYAKAYNAKTRKLRVENTDGGTQWWQKALKPFRRHRLLNRDQLEDAALARKESAEGLPHNVQDFKDHPLYVLERHLKRNEVLHPKNVVGKVNVGSSASNTLESVYRRQDVHVVRSADRWYRLGREIKLGEQPLKYATPQKASRPALDDAEDSKLEEGAGIGLYAAYQTELYVPPPVVRGRIPKNAFGNLDVYVPSMIPAGGTHIRHREASKAARIVGIDYADAVTGFQFKGRHGSAIVEGCIVAEENAEAVRAVIDGLAYLQEETKNLQRRSEALRMWKRFFVGLKIVERVKAYATDDEQEDVQKQINEAEMDARQTDDEEGGGFFPDDSGDIAVPTGGGSVHYPEELHEFDDGFMKDGSEDVDRDDADYGEGGVLPEADSTAFVSSVPDEDVQDEGNSVSVDPLRATLVSFGSSLLSQSQPLLPTRANPTPNKSNIIYHGPSPRSAFISNDTDDNSGKGPLYAMSDLLNYGPPIAKGPKIENVMSGALIDPPSPKQKTACGSKDRNCASRGSDNPTSEVETSNDHVGSASPGGPDKAIQEEDVGDDSDDQGSLPSHDPEDEDAEPEWLLSDEEEI